MRRGAGRCAAEAARRVAHQLPPEDGRLVLGVEEADRFAKSIYYYLNDAYTNCSSLNEMSEYLNDRKVQTPRGGSWYPSSVKNMLTRLKIGEYNDN